MRVFYTGKTAEVYFDDSTDTLFLKYLEKVKDTKEFVEINTEVLNAFKTLRTQKFVADIRKMGIISLESQNWVVDNLIPGMLDHLKGKPLHHAQLIDPKEVFAKVSGTNIKSKAKSKANGLVVRQFTSQDELTNYLRTV
ncbi:MAG: hypothetical protein AAF519_08170 [Bacteroidota bacterium]